MATEAESRYYAERQMELGGLLVRDGLDAIIVTDHTDVRYLCGFTGSNGLFVLTADDSHFFTDSRYTLQAGFEVGVSEIHTCSDLDRECASLLNARDFLKIGISFDSITVSRFRKLEELYPGASLADVGGAPARLRLIKSETEIQRLLAASRLAEEAFLKAAGCVRKGATEREAALVFQIEALRLGAEGLAFETILAGGERGALPHAPPSDRPFSEGDLVVFDFGIKLDGYCSDQTMMLKIGSISDEAAEVYSVVSAARRAAALKVSSGVSAGVVDAEARNIIKNAGYGDFFGHGTGHGLGLLVHEAPTIGPKSEQTLEAGMVFSIEPGIYLPGKFGVRLEDIVCVTGEGFRPLTTLSKELGAYS